MGGNYSPEIIDQANQILEPIRDSAMENSSYLGMIYISIERLTYDFFDETYKYFYKIYKIFHMWYRGLFDHVHNYNLMFRIIIHCRLEILEFILKLILSYLDFWNTFDYNKFCWKYNNSTKSYYYNFKDNSNIYLIYRDCFWDIGDSFMRGRWVVRNSLMDLPNEMGSHTFWHTRLRVGRAGPHRPFNIYYRICVEDGPYYDENEAAEFSYFLEIIPRYRFINSLFHPNN